MLSKSKHWLTARHCSRTPFIFIGLITVSSRFYGQTILNHFSWFFCVYTVCRGNTRTLSQRYHGTENHLKSSFLLHHVTKVYKHKKASLCHVFLLLRFQTCLNAKKCVQMCLNELFFYFQTHLTYLICRKCTLCTVHLWLQKSQIHDCIARLRGPPFCLHKSPGPGAPLLQNSSFPWDEGWLWELPDSCLCSADITHFSTNQEQDNSWIIAWKYRWYRLSCLL